MRIAFIGIGALGGYFGGRLAKAGNDVIFLARGATLEALRKNGLRIESPLGDFALPKVQATSDPAAVGHVDAVFVTTKAWQVTEAAQQIRGIVGPETVVVPLQNGVEAYDQLAAVLGSGHVLDGLCHILAMVIAPGVVRHAGPKAVITIGERNNARTPRLEKLVECLSTAELDTRVPDNILVALWEKFEFVASFGGVSAITRAPAGVIRSVPEARSLLERAAQEIVGLAARRRHSDAVGICGKHDEISRLVAALRHGFDAARSDRGSALGARSSEWCGRPAGTRLQFPNSRARVHLQRTSAWRTACPWQADVLNLLDVSCWPGA